MIKPNNQRGSLVISILIVSMFLMTIVTGLIVLANANLSRAKGRIYLLQAQYAAESGADAAIAALNADTAEC
jgi:type II secretory pathway component PulK